MEIYVDEQVYQSTGQPDQTIGELTDEICHTASDQPQRMVVSLHCDGQPVPDDNLQKMLDTSANQFGRLDLQTQPVGPLVESILIQAIELVENSSATRQKAADLLDQGQHTKAMEQLQGFFNTWRQVQDAMLAGAQALEVDLDAIRVNDLTLAEIFNAIKQQLTELKNALENGDLVVVGDILRYEFDKPFVNWIAFLNQLRELAESTGS